MTTSSTLNSLRRIPALLAVDRGSPDPLHQQIYASYRTRILCGNLRPGELIPSSRELARDLEVSRMPVLNAYSQLLAEGYFESRVGSGTFVASSLPRRPNSHPAEVAVGTRSEVRVISAHASCLPKYERPVWAESLGPFQVGQPALEEFPLRIWSKLVSRYARNMKVSGLQYGNPLGSYELRQAIATYLRTSRSVRCEPQQIMIVSGSQQALDISVRVLLDADAQVWVEEPGYWLVHHVLKAAGCRIVPVPVDKEGLMVAIGTKLCRNARAAFVAPSHQYPLGVTMNVSRRLQLLEWAEKARAWIIEDDYDSEFRYDALPIASLQGLDRSARVIYVGTFSKVLFPSLRLGYIVVPRDLLERFAAVRQSMDLCPADATQAIVAEFIREGHFARHIRKMRTIYATRRRVLVDEIQRQLGDLCRIVGAEAGMHVTLLMRSDGKRDQEIAVKATERKLWLSPLSLSYIGTPSQQGLVLGFGNTREEQIPGAVRVLKRILTA